MTRIKTSDEVLNSIDGKLGALLAIAVVDHLSEDRRASRSLDVILHDAGLGTGEIADLLGKSQRAVQLAVQPTARQAA